MKRERSAQRRKRLKVYVLAADSICTAWDISCRFLKAELTRHPERYSSSKSPHVQTDSKLCQSRAVRGNRAFKMHVRVQFGSAFLPNQQRTEKEPSGH